jgi:DNA-binding response OmpR family regulator
MLALEPLERAGYRVEVAGSSVEALNKARLAPIEAAVIDLGLPDGKGDHLVRELRRLRPRMPVIIASGYPETHLRERFSGEERLAFLPKPYTQEQLLATLGELMAHR